MPFLILTRECLGFDVVDSGDNMFHVVFELKEFITLLLIGSYIIVGSHINGRQNDLVGLRLDFKGHISCVLT